MTLKQERHIFASVCTILFMGLVILLLWLLKITVNKPVEQDYIEVTVTDELEEIPEPVIPKVKPDPAPSQEKDPGAAASSKTEPNNQPTKQSAEQMVSEEEQLAIVQQRRADSIAEANRQAKQKAENLIGGFTFTEQDDQGTAANTVKDKGPGTSYKGSGNEGENKWSLAGRGLVGTLPKPVGDDFSDGDIVVLKIQVDVNGNVIGEPEQAAGTYATSSAIKMAKEAAKKAKFTKGTQIKQEGTITYKFKVN